MTEACNLIIRKNGLIMFSLSFPYFNTLDLKIFYFLWYDFDKNLTFFLCLFIEFFFGFTNKFDQYLRESVGNNNLWDYLKTNPIPITL